MSEIEALRSSSRLQPLAHLNEAQVNDAVCQNDSKPSVPILQLLSLWQSYFRPEPVKLQAQLSRPSAAKGSYMSHTHTRGTSTLVVSVTLCFAMTACPALLWWQVSPFWCAVSTFGSYHDLNATFDKTWQSMKTTKTYQNQLLGHNVFENSQIVSSCGLGDLRRLTDHFTNGWRAFDGVRSPVISALFGQSCSWGEMQSMQTCRKIRFQRSAEMCNCTLLCILVDIALWLGFAHSISSNNKAVPCFSCTISHCLHLKIALLQDSIIFSCPPPSGPPSSPWKDSEEAAEVGEETQTATRPEAARLTSRVTV